MARVYKCDACSIMIERPHDVKMKEFYVVCDFDDIGVFPINCTHKVKVHLCEKCYKGLRAVARKLEGKDGDLNA